MFWILADGGAPLAEHYPLWVGMAVAAGLLLLLLTYLWFAGIDFIEARSVRVAFMVIAVLAACAAWLATLSELIHRNLFIEGFDAVQQWIHANHLAAVLLFGVLVIFAVSAGLQYARGGTAGHYVIMGMLLLVAMAAASRVYAIEGVPTVQRLPIWEPYVWFDTGTDVLLFVMFGLFIALLVAMRGLPSLGFSGGFATAQSRSFGRRVITIALANSGVVLFALLFVLGSLSLVNLSPTFLT